MADTWAVVETPGNATGRYFALSARSLGALRAPVTVKLSTRHGTLICLTCRTADACPHGRRVRAYLADAAKVAG